MMEQYIPHIAIVIVLIIVFGFKFLISSVKRAIAIGLVVAGTIWISQTYNIDPNAIWANTVNQVEQFF